VDIYFFEAHRWFFKALVGAVILAFFVLSPRAVAATYEQELSVRVLGVSQYTDRMPISNENGDPVPPRLVTVVEFGFQSCAEARPENYEAVVQVNPFIQSILIRHKNAPKPEPETCAGAKTWKELRVSTKQIVKGVPLQIANPALVEILPDVE
jgi:hypothetical protein